MNRFLCALIFFALVSFSQSCRSKKQYHNGMPPNAPDRFDTTMSPGDLGGTKDAGLSQGAGGALTSPAAVSKRMGEWNQKKAVWGVSAGNIVIGSTSYNEWVEELNDMFEVSSVSLGFSAEDYNIGQQNGRTIATTVKSIVIVPDYLGDIEIFLDDKGASFKMLESLTQREEPFYTAKKDNSDISGDKTSRGAEFFKAFYRGTIAKTKDTSFDCFSLGYCSAFEEPEHYGMVYSSPKGEWGYFYISIENDKVIQVVFEKPDKLPAGQLASEQVVFDALAGRFLSEKTLLEYGLPYEEALEVLENQGVKSLQNRTNSVSYLGVSLYFDKMNKDRAFDPSYSQPEPTDLLSGYSLFPPYEGRVLIGSQSVLLNDPERGKLSRDGFRAFFKNMKEDVESILREEGSTIYYSRLVDVESVVESETYEYEVLYQKLGEPAKLLSIRGGSKAPTTVLSVYAESMSDEELLAKKLSIDEEGVSLSSVKIGSNLEIKDLDVYDREIAKVELNGKEVVVDYYEDATLTKKFQDGENGGVKTEIISTEAITFEGMAVYLTKTPCESGTCRVVEALSFSEFYKLKDDGEPSNSIEVCDGKLSLSLGMAKKDFLSKVQNVCVVLAEEYQVGTAEKTSFYLPKDRMRILFDGDGGYTLSEFLVYK